MFTWPPGSVNTYRRSVHEREICIRGSRCMRAIPDEKDGVIIKEVVNI